LCRSYGLRVLRGFQRDGDDLIGEWPIEGLGLPGPAEADRRDSSRTA